MTLQIVKSNKIMYTNITKQVQKQKLTINTKRHKILSLTLMPPHLAMANCMHEELKHTHMVSVQFSDGSLPSTAGNEKQ